MHGRRKIAVVAIVLVIIVLSSTFSISFYEYETKTKFGNVQKLLLDPYYNGKSLPPPYVEQESSYTTDATVSVNVTFHYELGNFMFTFWKNNTLGNFEFGLEFGFAPGSKLYSPPAGNVHLVPDMWLSLLSAKFSGSGFLGFTPLSLRGYDFVTGIGTINFTNDIETIPWALYQVNQTMNMTTRQGITYTLGNVYNLYPLITDSNKTLIANYLPGQYYLTLKLDLYDILPWGTKNIGTVTVSEPWVQIVG